MKTLTIYNIVCSTALIDAGEQVLYLKLNQYNKIVSKKKKNVLTSPSL